MTRNVLELRPVKTVQPTTEVAATKTVSTQQQSFELVQTLLLVSFTSLCYLRNLLPSECFEDRDYEAIKPEAYWPFKEFVSQAEPSQNLLGDGSSPTSTPESRRTRRFKIITQGRSPKSDKLLLWLNSIFECLAQGYLDSVQLSVILEKDKPNEVVESYTFSFAYQQSSVPTIDGVLFSDSHGKTVTVKNARHGMNTIIRYLIQISQTLPDLPDTRFLTVHLFYTSACPEGYNPPGFRENNQAETMMVPDTPLWKMQETDLGNMDAGFHSVGLKIAYLSAVQDLDAAGEPDIPIPAELEYTRSMPRRSARIASRSVTRSPSIQPLESKVNAPSIELSVGKDSLSQHPIGQYEGRPQLTQDLASQQSGATETRLCHQLQEMIRTPSPVMNLKVTQPIADIGSTRMIFSNGEWTLVGPKMKELSQKREAHNKRKRREKRKSRQTTRCECGFPEGEGEMVQCDCCDDWQHKHCYALDFIEPNDLHVCYTCLSGDDGMELLGKLESTAKLRRTFWHIRETDRVQTDEELAEGIGCDMKSFHSQVTRLRKEKLVLPTPGSRKTRSSRLKVNGVPRYLVLEDNIKKSFMEQGILNPLWAIGHYYQMQQAKDTAGIEMPPPAIPRHEQKPEDTPSPMPINPRKRSRDEEPSGWDMKRTKISDACSPLNASED